MFFHQLTFIFVFLGIMLIFPLSCPLLRPSLGITLVFLSHTHCFVLLWVSHLFFISHAHYFVLPWVSHLFFISHTHYFVLPWVSHLFFLSHTHYFVLPWVSHLFFLSHAHYFVLLWVSHLFFISHAHYFYLVKIVGKIHVFSQGAKSNMSPSNQSNIRRCQSSHL